jgi:hypothetical protein
MFVMLGTEMACPQPSYALPSDARRGAPRYPTRQWNDGAEMIRRQTRQPAPRLSEPLRVRHEPPTIEEAVRAAQNLTSDLEQQVEIAAGLMGMAHDEVREHVRHQPAEPLTQSSLASGRMRGVVVERRSPRLIGAGRPSSL